MKIIKLFTLIVVLAFLYACGTSNDTVNVPGPGSGYTHTPYSGDVPPTDLLAGTSTFIANGGNCTDDAGDECNGGSGGAIVAYGIRNAGDIWYTTSGSVEISVTVPTVDPDTDIYGTNKLTISADKVATLDPVAPCEEYEDVPVYLKTNDSNVYYCVGTDETIASGLEVLEVQEGATLTLPQNYINYQDNSAPWHQYGSAARISLDKAVVINGTVKPAADGVSLIISSSGVTGALLQIGAGGHVTTTPTAPSTDGARMGLFSSGYAINAGEINASGSNGTTGNGGSANNIYFSGATGVYNTGSILAKGGASSEGGAGGNGSEIWILAYSGTLFNSDIGTIDNSGGNGATTVGGGWYKLYLRAGYNENTSAETSGNVFVSGSLTSNSGDADTGAGSDGTDIQLESYGGKVWSNATISSKGGNSTEGSGGGGGNLIINAFGGFVPSEGIQLGGNIIDLSGGNGATGGGSGGQAEFTAGGEASVALSYIMTGPSVWLKGFTNISLDGGDGVATGGTGGGAQIMSLPLWMINGGYAEREPCGAIFNQVPISARGGDTAAGTGGQGGMIMFIHVMLMALPPSTIISNSGNIDVSGGVGDIGGNSGIFGVESLGELTNSGIITARGGTGTTTGGDGAFPMPMGETDMFPVGIYLWAAGDITNSGVINASGGDATNTGGKGGEIALEAVGKIRNSVNITVAGGNATTIGGNGGSIFLVSETPPTSNSGSLIVTGGTGATAGNNGSSSID